MEMPAQRLAAGGRRSHDLRERSKGTFLIDISCLLRHTLIWDPDQLGGVAKWRLFEPVPRLEGGPRTMFGPPLRDRRRRVRASMHQLANLVRGIRSNDSWRILRKTSSSATRTSTISR